MTKDINDEPVNKQKKYKTNSNSAAVAEEANGRQKNTNMAVEVPFVSVVTSVIFLVEVF